MKDKEMIEENELIEIANTIVETDFTYRGMCWQGDSFVSCPYGEPINCQSCLTAKNILDKGYRKLPEDSEVWTKNQIISLEHEWYKIGYDKARKETAEKILQPLYDACKDDSYGQVVVDFAILERLAKQFGVEIKE